MQPYYQDDFVTLYHGDCREVLPHLTADDLTLVSDVPYGRALRSGWNGAHGDCSIENDRDTRLRDEVITWAQAHSIPAIIFGSPAVARPAGLEPWRVLIWDKGDHVGMGDLSWPWKPNYEEIYVIGDGFKGRRTSSVLRYFAVAGTVAVNGGRSHPMEKPVSLMMDLIQKCPGATIIDPFMGSGTTLVAAKTLGRKAIGIEIKEKYCEAAVRRMAQEPILLEAV